MEFETVETQMIFDDNGKIERIVPVVRNDAHKLIEECMLAANVCAADFLLKNKHGALYRNHLGPTPEKLSTLREQLGRLGLSLGGGDKPTPKDYAELASKIKDREDQELLQTMLLRSMQQAMYEAHNEGHFGLAYEHYAHFTSPIRRYPDLMVHRAIKAVLLQQKYQPQSWTQAGAHTSFAELRADDASRDVENWLKTYYMQDKIGEVFGGKVTGMTNFELFVTLDDIHIEGLVHISDLGEDYFNYLPEIMAIEGERSGVRFSMGERVTVKVARADLDTSKIDLVLVSGGTVGKKGRKASRKSSVAEAETIKSTSKKAKAKAQTTSQRSKETGKSASQPAGKGGRNKQTTASTVQQQSLQMVDGKITLVKKKSAENSSRKAAKSRGKRK